MSKVTEEARELLKIYNDHGIAERFGTEAGRPLPWISYRIGESGRAYRTPAWQVHRNGFKTDAEAYWQDYGNKTFCVFNQKEKDALFEEAQAWTLQTYGVSLKLEDDWVRSPFGAYHQPRVIADFKAALKAARKEAKDVLGSEKS